MSKAADKVNTIKTPDHTISRNADRNELKHTHESNK